KLALHSFPPRRSSDLGVLWPRGVQPMVRDATIARVASWLGSEHLRVDESGRLSLGPGVRTDWALFRELVRRSHGDPATGTVLLEDRKSTRLNSSHVKI